MKGFFKGLGRLFAWTWKHKVLSIFLTVSAIAGFGIMGAFIAGTMVSGVIVEILAIAGCAGIAQGLVFGSVALKDVILKKREMRLAKKIKKYQADKELSASVSNDKFLKLSKKLANTTYKLCKSQFRTGKSMSIFSGRRFFANLSSCRAQRKIDLLNAEINKTKLSIVDKPTNGKIKKLSKLQNKIDKIKGVGVDVADNRWTLTLDTPFSEDSVDADKMNVDFEIQKTQIACHNKKYCDAFQEIAVHDKLSQGNPSQTIIRYPNEIKRTQVSAVTPAIAQEGTLMLLYDAKELANSCEGNIFPIVVTITSKQKTNNVKINNIDELDNFIAEKESEPRVPIYEEGMTE